MFRVQGLEWKSKIRPVHWGLRQEIEKLLLGLRALKVVKF